MTVVWYIVNPKGQSWTGTMADFNARFGPLNNGIAFADESSALAVMYGCLGPIRGKLSVVKVTLTNGVPISEPPAPQIA